MQIAEMKFIVDQNVGKMAKWLRMAGFDVALFTGADDAALIAAALAEGRILLTRDRRIMKRGPIAGGRIRAVLIESDRLPDQVRQVVAALNLDRSQFRPFTLCLECNQRLEVRQREAIRERIPPYVGLTQDRFAECPACGRLFWPGSHRRSMSLEMAGMPGSGNPRPGAPKGGEGKDDGFGKDEFPPPAAGGDEGEGGSGPFPRP